MSKKLVSVIIPVYNCEEYLNQCLTSIEYQSYENIELIIINDYSTDNSNNIINDYKSKFKLIKILNDKSFGPSYSRNMGLEKATGQFIIFVDSDDYLEKNAISDMIKHMSEKIDIVFSNYNIIDSNNNIKTNNPLEKNCILNKNDLIKKTLEYLEYPYKSLLFSHSWSIMFKSSLLKDIKFNESLYSFEDVDLNFRYLINVKNAYYTSKITYNHRIRSRNYSSTGFSVNFNPSKLFGYFTAIESIKNFINNYKCYEELKYFYARGIICITIIQLIRICGQINKNNKYVYFKYIKNILNSQQIKENIKFYKRKKGNSIIIPILIKLKFVYLLILFCKLKAKIRYG